MSIALAHPNSPNRAPVLGILTRLREGTCANHRSLEAVSRIDDPALTRERYGEILSVFESFLQEYEPALTRGCSPALKEFIGVRAKLAWVRRDLANLGASQSAWRPARIEYRNDAERLGALYVLEGSTLGAQSFLPGLAKRLSLTPDVTRYFRAYGESTGTMWRATRALLETEIDADSLGSALAAARATFAGLESGFLTIRRA